MKRRGSRNLVSALTLLTSLSMQHLAFAQANIVSQQDKTAADALFDAGRSEMQQGNYEAACPKFVDSHRLDPGVGTLLNLALCYKQWGKTASARSSYREAAALARQQGQKGREELARKEAAALEGDLTKLVIEVPPETKDIEGLTVHRDGEAVPQTMWGVPVPVDPGTYTVKATAPGYATVDAEVEAQGKGQTVALKVPPMAKAASGEGEGGDSAGQPLSADTTSDVANARSGPGPWPWVIGGAGLAVAGVGTLFAFQAKSQYDESMRLCPGFPSGPCSAQEVDRQSELKNATRTSATIAYVGWGVGGAALAGAAAWLLLAPKPSDQGEGARDVSVVPTFSPGSLGVVASGRF